MMLQPWMGSDFTNDDLVRESSFVEDYVPKALGAKEVEGLELLGLELIPHEDAPVVWGRLELWIERESFAPRVFLYFEEAGPGEFAKVRTMHFRDIREIQGRPLPHFWEMIPEHKPGHRTTITLEKARFDQPMDDELFTQENLRRAEGAR
jgi:outer membrane lipoprotein-sorting protein